MIFYLVLQDRFSFFESVNFHIQCLGLVVQLQFAFGVSLEISCDCRKFRLQLVELCIKLGYFYVDFTNLALHHLLSLLLFLLAKVYSLELAPKIFLLCPQF